MNILVQDIRYAFRTLARSSGFAILAIINNALAQLYFPDENPLDLRLMTGSPDNDNPYTRIVGVVGDVSELALDQPPSPTL